MTWNIDTLDAADVAMLECGCCHATMHNGPHVEKSGWIDVGVNDDGVNSTTTLCADCAQLELRYDGDGKWSKVSAPHAEAP